jgi:fluoride ion exporter CrcB/FEX
MHESNALWEQGALIKAGLNVVASLVFGLAALRLGIYVASR